MNKFTINTDTYSIVKEMSDSEVGMLFKAIYDYQINGTEVTPPEIRIAFKIFLMGFEKEKEISNTRKKAGYNGGKQTQAKASKPKQNQAKSDENQVDILEPRRVEFKKSLQEHLDTYGRDMLNAFYLYWTEPNPSKTKMRFELEKTWSVDLRLSNWARNNKDIATTPKVEEIKYNRI